jgi:hypothetical protein
MRDAMKMDSAAMEATAMRMTTLRKSGRPVMPASVSAMTKGDAATPELPKSWGLFAGTRIPMKMTQVR